MNLLIDTGNSNLKIALSRENGDIARKKHYPYRKQNFQEDLNKIFRSYSSEHIKPGEVTGIGIAVTNPVLKKILRDKFKKLNAVFIENKTSPCVKINYQNKLGNDRVAAINGAQKIYGKENMLVIDLGTATTLNMISGGEFMGGAIVPGIQTGLNSLSTSTPLPKTDIKFEEEIIFDNTKDSISIGTTQQTLFYLERAVSELRSKYSQLYVICTGGLSEFIAEHTNIIDMTDRDLVLKGINVILDHYKK
jgi:type III pantothenate kinase